MERQAHRQRVEPTRHPPLKAGNWKPSLAAPDLTQAPIEPGHVPAFIPTLTRQVHAQFPRRLGEIHETLRGDLNRSCLVVHVAVDALDRKSTRLNSSHGYISYAVFCLKKKIKKIT